MKSAALLFTVIPLTLLACGPRPLAKTARNPAFNMTRAEEPTAVVSTMRCLGHGAPAGARYPNAGTSFNVILESRLHTKGAPASQELRTLVCDKLGTEPGLAATREIEQTWNGGEAFSALISAHAAATGAKSLLVPLVIIGEVCDGTDALGRPLCEWTTTEFAAYLFASDGTLLWRSVGFAGDDDADQVAAKIVSEIPATLARHQRPPSAAKRCQSPLAR